MKKIIILNLIVLVLSTISCTSVQSQGPYVDNVDIANVTIYKSGVSTGLPLTSTSTNCSTIFGSPTSSQTITSELDGLSYLEYFYSGGRFSFQSGSLSGIELDNTNFKVVINSTTINIGDPISDLNTPFPYSYNWRRDGALHMGTKSGTDILDQSIAIFYNSSNVITKIVIEY